MAEKSSLRRSLRNRSLDGRPLRRSLRNRSLDGRSLPYISPEEVPVSDDGDDDDDDNNNVNKVTNKKPINESIQSVRTLRKRKVSFKECVTDLKEDSKPEKIECDSIEHLQKILSNKWYVDYYDNDIESVFDVKECCLCPSKFFTNFALRKHFDLEHKKNKFNCPSCSETFSREEDLKCHKRQMHPVRLMPSAMFRIPEVQEILHKSIKQEEKLQMTLSQPQRQLPQPSLVDGVIQAELQKQGAHPPVLTWNDNLKPSTETQSQKLKIFSQTEIQAELQKQDVSPRNDKLKPPTETPTQKLKILPQTEQIFKIPSLSHQQEIKTPLKTQLQNLQTLCPTEQQNLSTPCLTQLQIFETQSIQQIFKTPLKRKHSFQNSPPKTQNQKVQAPSQTYQLNLQETLVSQPQNIQTPSLAQPPRSLDRRQSFSHPNTCGICKKQFSQHSYLKIHMKSVHELVRETCELCKKTYSGKGQLLRHIKSAHWGERFECSFCPRSFKLKISAKKHAMSVHGSTLD